MRRVILAGLMMGVLGVAPMRQAVAQQGTGASAAAGATGTMPLEQLLPMTVHEAWVASGRNEDAFYAMVAQLTALSAEKRGVTLPDDAAAGKRAGETFKRIAHKDPGQLLYVVVDTMVRHAAEKQSATAATKG